MHRLLRIVFGIGVALLASTGTMAVSAQSDATPVTPSTMDWPVNLVLCSDQSCTGDLVTVNLALISAVDNSTGETIDSCYTSHNSTPMGCTLKVPVDGDYHIVWDDSMIPAGYVVAGDPFAVNPIPGQSNVMTVLTLGYYDPGVPTTLENVANLVLCSDQSCTGEVQTVEGATVSLVDDKTGEIVATCQTSSRNVPEGCVLVYPNNGAMLHFEFDDSLVPDGYVFARNFTMKDAFGNPTISARGYYLPAQPAPTDAAPAVTPTSAPVVASSLPKTGVGASDGSAINAFTVFFAAAGAVVAAGSATFVVGRRLNRQ
jgi:hypothetical protein